MKAIQTKYECPSCGNIITLNQVLQEVGGKQKFSQPNKCGCGRKGSFRLLHFKSIEVMFYDPEFEVVEIKQKSEAKENEHKD